MLLEEGACEEMMKHFTLKGKIEQNHGKHTCPKKNYEENECYQIVDGDTVGRPI